MKNHIKSKLIEFAHLLIVLDRVLNASHYRSQSFRELIARTITSQLLQQKSDNNLDLNVK